MTDSSLPPDLTAGFARFRANRYAQERERYRRMAVEGQRPRTMVVACSDARSGPEAVFDAAPGELFVVRNVAALVPVYAPDTRSHAASAAEQASDYAAGTRGDQDVGQVTMTPVPTRPFMLVGHRPRRVISRLRRRRRGKHRDRYA